MPFRRLGTIRTDPATVSSWISAPRSEPAQTAPQIGSSADHPTPSSKPAAPGPDHLREDRGSAPSPSFLIRGSQASQSGRPVQAAGWTLPQPRLDRVNSSELLRLARQVYFGYLSNAALASEPLGIVLSGSGSGRVVFDLPVMLPEEMFVPIEWLRGRGQGRGRGSRGGPGRLSL